MGAVSMDLNHAEPYVRDVSLERVPRLLSSRQLTGDATGTETVMGAYYGPSTEIQVTTDQFDSPQAFSRDLPVQRETTSGYRPNRRALAAQRLFRRSPGFEFVAPQYPSETILVTPKSTEKILDASKSTKVDKIVVDSSINREEFTRSTTSLVGDFHDTTDQTLMMDTYLRVRFEPTKFNEEWRTPPLWGVADSAPYMHDGRAETLLEAITMHDGEAAGTRDRFLTLPKSGRDAVLAFLETMVAPVAQPLTSVATR
ncbi:hypothetical protein CGZ80_07550 [Rhodopirellula sp. MGV]|nr:hypothetical protein CGZ80_07550 [Rhodopirellula sp. MGV]PNY34452.1 hypothetical protein C2E31_23620 [Rhodopirellula baltica]